MGRKLARGAWMAALLLVAAAATACFDDPYGDHTGGLQQPDGGDIPPGQRRTGTILFLETAFSGQPEMGDGPLIVVGPIDVVDDQVDPSYEEAEGSPFACKVYELTPEQYLDKGIDAGTLGFTIEEPDAPAVPPCNFDAVDGWVCSETGGSGGDIAVVDAGQGIYSLTDPAVVFGDDEVGRTVEIEGASVAANDGTYAIVAAVGQDTIHYVNPHVAAAAETGTPATYRTRAGSGPANQTDPISDDASLLVNLDAGGTGNFDDFEKRLDFGGHFSLDTASALTIHNVPLDGSNFTIGCDGDGGDCGEAMATALNIETTDGPIDPELPTKFPDPVGKYVRVFCILLIGRGIVPAEASAYIQSSGATMVRSIFARAESADEIQEAATLTIVAGHAIGGFTIP